MYLFYLAILPTIILGSYIYKNDKIAKEPTSLLVKLAGCGLLSIVLTLFLTWLLELIFPFFANTDYEGLDLFSLAIYVFVGIALIEEFSKWIFTYIVAWNNKEFDHIYDAIVYCAFVSLSFATVENLLYVFGSESMAVALGTALVRMIFSVPGHAFFGVLMGYYLGLAKLTSIHNIKDKSSRYLMLSILVPATCHFLFDYLLMVGTNLSMIIFLLYTVFLYILAISRVRRMSKVTTNLFQDPNQNKYIYNVFNPKIKFCSNCGTKLEGPYCKNCGTKNY